MPDNLTNPTQHDNSPDVPVVVDSSVQPQFPAPGRGDMLMNSEERLQLIEDNVRDYAIFTINTDGFIVSWNVGSERILGWREDEILGQSAAVIFTPEDQAGGAHAQEMKKAREAG